MHACHIFCLSKASFNHVFKSFKTNVARWNSPTDVICHTRANDDEYWGWEDAAKTFLRLEEKPIDAHCHSLTNIQSQIAFLSLKRKLNQPMSMSMEEFRQNFFSVLVYAQETKIQCLLEDRKMALIDLINLCRGTLGMCLGLSIISIVEVAILVPSALVRWLQALWLNTLRQNNWKKSLDNDGWIEKRVTEEERIMCRDWRTFSSIVPLSLANVTAGPPSDYCTLI